MKCLSSPLGEPIIAPPLVIQRGVWSLACIFDEPVSEHALKRAIECAGAHLHLA